MKCVFDPEIYTRCKYWNMTQEDFDNIIQAIRNAQDAVAACAQPNPAPFLRLETDANMVTQKFRFMHNDMSVEDCQQFLQFIGYCVDGRCVSLERGK